MIVAILLFILGIYLMALGGNCRAIFECVMLWDNIRGFSLEEFKNKSKDTNHDGKISWWEQTFPKDSLHKIKRVELMSYGFGLSFLLASLFYTIVYFFTLNRISFLLLYTITPVIFFAITGFSFSFYFKKYRPKQ